MRVLAGLIFTYLLFQTATLEELDPTAQQRQNIEQFPSQAKQYPGAELLQENTEQKQDEVEKTNSDPESNSKSQTPKEPSKAELESHDVPLTTSKPQTTKKTAEPKASKEADDDSLVITQCLDQNYTRMSCAKVFCPPWRRCIAGQCVCKMPYKCPRQDYHVCTLDGSQYYSMCQAKAISCRSNRPVFSHISLVCKAEEKVEVTVEDSGFLKMVMINTKFGKMFVCGNDWNMAAANVVCRNPLNVARGAAAVSKKVNRNLDKDLPDQCMSVRCTGSELLLAECTIYDPQPITENTVAIAKCYNEPKGAFSSFYLRNNCLDT